MALEKRSASFQKTLKVSIGCKTFETKKGSVWEVFSLRSPAVEKGNEDLEQSKEDEKIYREFEEMR